MNIPDGRLLKEFEKNNKEQIESENDGKFENWCHAHLKTATGYNGECPEWMYVRCLRYSKILKEFGWNSDFSSKRCETDHTPINQYNVKIWA